MPSHELPVIPEMEEATRGPGGDGYVVILYNDDWHPADVVVEQLQRATGYAVDRCVEIMLEAHMLGRAIAFQGSEDACERVASVLRQIRLQVETDRA